MTSLKILRNGTLVDADEAFLAQREIDAVVDIDVLKDRLKRQVDHAAEIERLKYITPGSGQAMTYQQKIEEARAFAQDADPDSANYPLLSSELGITAPDLAGVASTVHSAYQQWQQVGAAIEAARLATKKAISEAKTPEEAQAAADSVAWP